VNKNIKWSLFFLLLTGLNCSHAELINVYLKIKNQKLNQALSLFNRYLETNNIFTQYHFKPFIDQFPLHITLYMASFSKGQLPEIKEKISKIVKYWPVHSVNASKIVLKSGGYVMLLIENTPFDDGHNSILQQLSDALTTELYNLRDRNVTIPEWAQSDSCKRKAFKYYGSPGVFFAYEPHISLMLKTFHDERKRKAFLKKISYLIDSYTFPKIKIHITEVGIGFADSNGQIKKEITSFPLHG